MRRVEGLREPYPRFHDPRHTWATLQLRAGTPIHVVSKLLGHLSVTVTLAVYAHVLPEQHEQAAKAVDEWLDITSGSRPTRRAGKPSPLRPQLVPEPGPSKPETNAVPGRKDTPRGRDDFREACAAPEKLARLKDCSGGAIEVWEAIGTSIF
ncbi:MAG: tyrosine-type recombinase/integrase [Firmicutes bacterium]|nr:tyrosine-type recombinase/integrase [Bacillota bacterium]